MPPQRPKSESFFNFAASPFSTFLTIVVIWLFVLHFSFSFIITCAKCFCFFLLLIVVLLSLLLSAVRKSRTRCNLFPFFFKMQQVTSLSYYSNSSLIFLILCLFDAIGASHYLDHHRISQILTFDLLSSRSQSTSCHWNASCSLYILIHDFLAN